MTTHSLQSLVQGQIDPFLYKLLSKVTFSKGDLTQLHTDVIVNAANKTLLGGGGGILIIHTCIYF